MAKLILATVSWFLIAALFGCSGDPVGEQESNGGKSAGGLNGATKLPSEVQKLAENVYFQKGVLYLDSREPPWHAAQLQRAADRTKSYPKVAVGYRFDEAALPSLRRMPNLHSLTIWEISGSAEEGLQSLATLGQLRELTITEPALAKSALPHIAGLVQLEKLTLYGGAEFSDADLAALARLDSLESLCIFDAGVTDNGLTHLSKLSRLRWLMFFNSRVTYSGLLQLSDLKELEEVVTSPAWLFTDRLEAMCDAWPNFRGKALRGRDTSYLWDVQGKKLAAIVPSFTTFSPDGNLAAQYLGRRLYLMDARTGAVHRELADDCHNLADGLHFPIAFSGDGKWVAAGHPRRLLRVWRTGTGKLTWTRQPSDEDFAGPFPLAAVALSFDGTLLAAADYGGPIRIWDLKQKRMLRELVANAVIRLAFSREGNRLVARTGCELRVWDLENPSKAVEIPAALSFAFSEDEDIAVAHDPYDGVHFHSLTDGAVVRSRQGKWPNRPDVQLSTLSPAGQYLAIADRLGVVSIWNVGTGKLDHRVRPADCGTIDGFLHEVWCFTPKGKYLALRWIEPGPPE
jgi:WD40 repeat protein